MALLALDAYDKLMIKCNNIAALTTFVDSCPSPKTVTANGAAKQLPIMFNKSAGFFNGTTDAVKIPVSTDWAFGTGSYTLEGTFFWTTVQNSTIIDVGGFASNDGVYVLYQAGALYLYTNGTNRGNLSWTPTVNTKYHIAIVRNGTTTVTIYINGTSIGTISDATTITSDASVEGAIGRTATEPYFCGWIKEVRVSNVARYTGDFTPSTTQFVSDANTKLLMHFNTPANSPLGPAIYLDGTGDYISVADHADWDFGVGNFTLEGSFQFTAALASGTFLFDRKSGQVYGVQYYSGSLYLYMNNSGVCSFAWTPTVGAWYDVAVVREGTGSNQCYLFINGIKVAIGTSNYDISSTEILAIGGNNAGGNLMTGFVKEVRVSDVARYTANYTPSQTPFVADANTKLLIHGSENNGVTTFTDSETTAKTVTTNGDAKIKYTEDYRSCIFKDETGKFPYPVGSAKVDFFAIGDGVGYFDGANGTYLSLADSADWDMTDFTIETYFRTSGTGNYNLIDFPTNELALAFYGNNATYTFDGVVNGTRVNQTVAVPLVNTWTHYRLVRSGTNAYCFVNGTLVGTTNVGTDAISPSALNIGSNGSWGSGWLGLLDNIRVSNTPRATATFNPPEDFSSWGGYSQILWLS